MSASVVYTYNTLNVCGLISATIVQSSNKYYMYMNNSEAHNIVGLVCDSLVTSQSYEQWKY